MKEMLSHQINEYIKSKKFNNIVKIRLGKRIYDDAFRFIIGLHEFEYILNKIKEINSHRNIKYNKYRKYYDDNKVMTINEDGSHKCIEIRNNKNTDIKLNNKFDLMFELVEYIYLENDNFQPQYDYDKIVTTESITFTYDNNIEIEFMLIKDKIKYHEISININSSTIDNNNIGNIINMIYI